MLSVWWDVAVVVNWELLSTNTTEYTVTGEKFFILHDNAVTFRHGNQVETVGDWPESSAPPTIFTGPYTNR